MRFGQRSPIPPRISTGTTIKAVDVYKRQGLYDLDRMLTGLHGGELVLVGARPAMGKTSMALGVTQFAATKAKRCVAVFSMEMPSEQIGLRLLCSAASINMQRVRSGMLSDEDVYKRQIQS